jgi:hypothetical protein
MRPSAMKSELPRANRKDGIELLISFKLSNVNLRLLPPLIIWARNLG